jgi:hypothetical protein
MSRNAIAAMAVIFVSGFAGCAATARAQDATARETPKAAHVQPAPAASEFTPAHETPMTAAGFYVRAEAPCAQRVAPPA